LYQAFASHGITPDYVAGHSLGEYSALTAAGSLSFEEAVATVRARGGFMEQAVPSGQGAMAAVLGGEREALAALCEEITSQGQLVELANMNCPGQIVVSGSKEGVEQLVSRVKEIGAKRAIPLEVSGPFHSSLMKPAAQKLEAQLSTIHIQNAKVPVIANVTARPVTDNTQISSLLVEQVYSPVLWQDSVNWLIEQGVDTFVEIGPGNVLAGLIKKIDKTVAIYNVQDLESLEATVVALK
jgi:[acyl-carrier-protein] S-malonyltransferase